VSIIDEMGVQELYWYIDAYYMLPKIKQAKEEAIEDLYDDCDPTMTFPDYDLGVTRKVGVNVEDMAILIIERKEGFDRMIKRYERKAELFEIALESLTPREIDVINVRYFGKQNDMGLTLEYFHKTLQEAEEKLCSSICSINQDKKRQWNAAEKLARQEKAKEWRQAQ
jgi:hypothetical protein